MLELEKLLARWSVKLPRTSGIIEPDETTSDETKDR
jgi:hypothetical protein